MKKTFDCKTITPMFLAGANKNKAEIRAPSLKGVMRYWWRAAQHASDITTMWEEEAHLFGSVDKNIGGKSRFRLIATTFSRVNTDQDERAMLPHKKGRNASKAACFEGSFQINIISRQEAICHNASVIAELSAIIGGLGRRTRRGFGAFSFQPNGVCGGTRNNSEDSEELRKKLIKRIKVLLNTVASTPQYKIFYDPGSGTARLTYDVPTPFDRLDYHYPTILEVMIKPITKKLDDILKYIGQKSHHFAQNTYQKACGSGGTQTIARQSSPICFSFYRYHGTIFIVTTLLASSINNTARAKDIATQKQFRDEVLTYA